MDNILFSKKSDEWYTPVDIYNLFIDNNYFDPCPIKSSFNGLDVEWGNKNFVNPPYSDIKRWTTHCIQEYVYFGRNIVLLVPVRTDTEWFNNLVNVGAKLLFVKGRLRFSNKGSAPFPSVFIFLGYNKLPFCDFIEREKLVNYLKGVI